MNERTNESAELQGVADGYTHGSASFFAMYRFDFMLDRQLRPYVMEVMSDALMHRNALYRGAVTQCPDALHYITEVVSNALMHCTIWLH